MGATNETKQMLSKLDRAKITPLFRRHGVVETGHDAIDNLMKEIQLDGGNTLANLIRGYKGVEYDEVIADVVEVMGLKPVSDWKKNERKVLEKVFQDIVKNMTESEKENLQEIFKKAGEKFDGNFSSKMGKKVMAVLMTNTLLKKSIMEAVKKTLARLALKAAGERAAGYVIPGLNVIMAAWTVFDIAGPAYRKTVPTVVEIALLRLEE